MYKYGQEYGYPRWADGWLDEGQWVRRGKGGTWERRIGDPGWVIRSASESEISAACYGEGYALGRVAFVGDDLPHPSHWPFPENFYHGLRAALSGRGLDISMFMRVVEK